MTIDPDKMFGQEPVQIQCRNCDQVTTTRVEGSIKSEGWMFGICCCLFGSWLTSLLVKLKLHHHNNLFIHIQGVGIVRSYYGLNFLGYLNPRQGSYLDCEKLGEKL